MSKNPRSTFYWKDWRNDENLRLCSYAARGLWMELLCLMAQGDRYGYLELAGKPLSNEQIARLTGGSTDEVERLMRELIAAGVPDLDRSRRILNRRMVREEHRRKEAVKNGKKGGPKAWKKRPDGQPVSTGKQKKKPQGVNPPLNPGVGSGVDPPYTPKPLTTTSSTTATGPPSPEPQGRNGAAPPDAAPDAAIAVIAAFDDARARAFGEEQRRPWPHADDRVWAERWLEAGAPPELLEAVFAEVMARKQARDPDDPPSSLSYCDGAVRKALRPARGGAASALPGPGPPDLSRYTDEEIRAAREKNFREHGIWNEKWGPRPDEHGGTKRAAKPKS